MNAFLGIPLSAYVHVNNNERLEVFKAMKIILKKIQEMNHSKPTKAFLASVQMYL